jgi:hypothetical protein
MKTNNSGMTSLEIVTYAIIGIACLLIATGVIVEIKEVINDNNISVSEK